MKILGIDPGLRYAGFSILEKSKTSARLLESGVLVLPGKHSVSCRLMRFHDFFKEKIVQHGITDIALETPFLGKNAQSFLKLGYLRGILFLLSEQYNLNVREFSPSEVKRAVVGSGGAGKEEVARVIGRLFPLLVTNRLDETDAIGVGLCALWHCTSPLSQRHFR